MTIDPSIREQTYPYFLQEATELLRILEQGLLNLRENFSINTIHTLMRATHTLKGAAASVELKTIAIIAHALEDVFKALCQPGVCLEPEVEALLFEGYDCLALALATEFANESVSNTEVIDRATHVFTQLQEKLGDWMGQETHLPTSADLGFDIVQSMFEVGVTQRLNQLAITITSAQAQTIATVLRTQAEVFFGLAESLELPGFGAIAQAVIAALDHHPDQVMAIAHCALSDFQKAQAAVLEGDRSQGGHPSKTLQQLAGLSDSASISFSKSVSEQIWVENSEPSANPADPTAAQFKESGGFRKLFQRIRNFILDEPELDIQSNSISESEAIQSSGDDQNLDEPGPHLLESIWGGYIASDEPPKLLAPEASTSNLEPHHSEQPHSNLSLIASLATLPADESETTIQTIPLQRQSPKNFPPAGSSGKRTPRTHVVRVNVEDLKYLSHSVGELLTNQNHQFLQNEQLQTEVRALLKRLQHHHQQLNQLYEYPVYSSNVIEQRQPEQKKWQKKTKLEENLRTSTRIESKDFDPLELERYSDSHLLVQSLLDDMVQLTEVAEAVDLFVHQASQTLEKQRLLLSNARNALMDARMLALGETLNRLPSVLQQLEAQHNKSVILILEGTEVLVDKVVAEKLYEPLLHLVRNAFDHGIESAEIRQQRGKPPEGQLEICAYHQSRYLVIEVRDDGEGLDFERIRQRAVESRLISLEQASTLSESQLTDLLFESGFSTVAQVNTLSGRGIGLDVVRNQLQTLQASIAVRSRPHQGTTFTLQIPLDLAIAKLLICQTNSQSYALLTDSIEQILMPQASQVRERESGKALRWTQDATEQLIPLYSLAAVINYHSVAFQPATAQSRSMLANAQPKYVILVRCPNGLVGLEVDQMIGEQELVIRPLGGAIEPPLYIQGASILANGRLTPVISAADLIQQKVFNPQQESYFSDVTTSEPTSKAVGMLPSTPQQLTAQSQPILVTSSNSNPSGDFSQSILIVEDSITARQTLALALQKSGYQVLQAKDGYEALDQLQNPSNVQLVICDLEMPRMNGFEFLSHCQRNPALADLPVIILTSRSSEKHRLLASQLGATAYITKPYIEHKLLEMIEKLLEPVRNF
jgi:chemotaxis family two-component system sensor histidine kinase/response regulator PixL